MRRKASGPFFAYACSSQADIRRMRQLIKLLKRARQTLREAEMLVAAQSRRRWR